MSTTVNRIKPAAQLLASGVMAILRSEQYDYVSMAAQTLVDAGVTCLEVTLTIPNVIQQLPELAATLPDNVCLGVGTVTTAEQAHAAVAAGATFLVCPTVCLDVLEAAAQLGIACYPGAWTPTEILTAWNAGATAVKLFPAASGGPEHLGRLRDPFPNIPLLPTGGVSLEQVPRYLAAGACAVGMGSPLLGDALEGGDLEGLRHRASTVLETVRVARKKQ
ncbi:MAG: bifunctional 4-hydroxy-2-oxoglutarate aldolase/2-dehydro-3-deoxy-phosphogluconate aldolase [Actinomycetota bacterium]|nr:bifunctional 4-hydroxy-2-oxoglutarate aldolase/2-dehydro-3-deoxy-phosphogluconate aldolase [Actinomycetota bacterium]